MNPFPLFSLPDEILSDEIFNHLDIETILKLPLVCKKTNALIKDKEIQYDRNLSIEEKMTNFKICYAKNKINNISAIKYAKEIKEYFNSQDKWGITNEDQKSFKEFVLIEITQAITNKDVERIKLLCMVLPEKFSNFTGPHPLQLAIELKDVNFIKVVMNQFKSTSFQKIPSDFLASAWSKAIQDENYELIKCFFKCENMRKIIRDFSWWLENSSVECSEYFKSLIQPFKQTMNEALRNADLQRLFNLSLCSYLNLQQFQADRELLAKTLSLAIAKNDLLKIKTLVCLGVDPFSRYKGASSNVGQLKFFFRNCMQELQNRFPAFAAKVAIWSQCASEAKDKIYFHPSIIKAIFQVKDNNLSREFVTFFTRQAIFLDNKIHIIGKKETLLEDIEKFKEIQKEFLQSRKTVTNAEVRDFIETSNSFFEFLEFQASFTHTAELMDTKAQTSSSINNNDNNCSLS